ncbi:MAG: CAP domain-containing protein [Actinomycetota bacterium]|nr:CAP domain-containing protein [Actinomycetota bacterium]
MRRTIAIFVALLLASAIFVLPPARDAGAWGFSQNGSFTLLNEYRAHHGRRVLRNSPSLRNKAQAWAEYLARLDRLVHSNLPHGVPPVWTSLAENVGYGANYRRIHTMWVRSDSHRVNMLNPRFDSVGVGMAWSGSNRLYAVHVFADFTMF